MEKIGDWIKEVRAPFLTLSVVLVFLGTAIAAAEGTLIIWRAGLALFGLIVLHISVNVLNDYSDYHTAIDFHTTPTPFSGGSGMLVAGKIAPAAAQTFGIACLALGAIVGGVFLWVTNIQLLPILIIGAFSVYFYTDLLARYALGELFAGLGLGFLPILGASFIQTEHYSLAAFAAAIPAAILTFNLLLLNEFPDLAADIQGGRSNLIIALGEPAAGKIYALALVVMYVWIVVASVAGIIPIYCLLALASVPVALKPMKWAWSHVHEKDKLLPALSSNIVTNLATHTLLGIGFLASIYV